MTVYEGFDFSRVGETAAKPLKTPQNNGRLGAIGPEVIAPRTVPLSREPAPPMGSSERMRRQRTKDTRAELMLRRELHSLGLRYRVHRRPIPSLRCQADVLFGPARIAVMIDGCFWHGCPLHGTWPKSNAVWWRDKIEGNQRKDESTDLALSRAGWTVVRVWEHEDPVEAAQRVACLVHAHRAGPRGATAEKCPSPHLGSPG